MQRRYGDRLVKIGGRTVRHGQSMTFQMAGAGLARVISADPRPHRGTRSLGVSAKATAITAAGRASWCREGTRVESGLPCARLLDANVASALEWRIRCLPDGSKGPFI
jgi:hypothetical protein